MIKSSIAALAVAAAATAILSFVCPPEAVFVGFVFWNDVIFNSSPDNICVPTTKEEIKKKIIEALATLALYGEQSVLVQFWSPTKAGNTFLLTTSEFFGIYGTDEVLKVYRSGCLHHAFYVHPDKNVSFGLPGLAFMERTPQQTQDVHNYPEDQRPLCEDNSMFSMKWGSFALPVILNDECVGVLEFIITRPANTYDVDMDEVYKALKFVGFQSSIKLDTPKRTSFTREFESSVKYESPEETNRSQKKQRKTQSRKYARYNVLSPLFGSSKEKAMKTVTSRFRLRKKVTESTFTNALRKVGITEWPWIRNTPTRASSGPETQTKPTASETNSSQTPESGLTSVWDEEISEGLIEQTPPPIASALDTQICQIVPKTSPIADEFTFYWDQGISEMSLEPTTSIQASASGIPACSLADFELDEMEDDQGEVGVLDQHRFNDILISLQECVNNHSGDMNIATRALRFE